MTTTQRIPAFCTQCRSRCGCTAIIEDGRLTGIEPDASHPSGARLCPKGTAAPDLVYHDDRLTRPLKRTAPKQAADPGWVEISWDEALKTIAGHMSRIKGNFGAEQVAFSITTPSGTHTSDSINWIERFIRGFGAANIVYSTEICNWFKDWASRYTYGSDIGTPDFANTDCVVLWGNNPATTWLARSIEVQKAVKRGAKLIVVDPRPVLYARRADHWLRVQPGTDQALALGLANIMITQGWFDAGFVTNWTNGPFLVRDDDGCLLRESDLGQGGSADACLAFDEETGQVVRYDTSTGAWLDTPRRLMLNGTYTAKGIACRTAFAHYAQVAAEYPPDLVEDITGVPANDLHAAAKTLADSPTVAYYAWNGVAQSTTSGQTDRAITLLYTLTGCYGARGGNVPGGVAPFNDISGFDLMTGTQKARTIGLDKRPLGPARTGWATAGDVYRAILSKKPYPVRMLFSFGGNLLVSQPETGLGREALDALEFHVHADFFMNETARHADIVLPVSTSWEREGLRTGFDASLEGLKRVQLRPAVIPPIGESRSDVDIVMALARRLGLGKMLFDCNADKGHDHMLAPAGITVAQLRARPEGIELPGEVALNAYAETDADGIARGFATPSKRIEIYSEVFARNGLAPVPRLERDELPQTGDERYPLRLGCAKTVAFCHSQHRNIAALRRLMPDPQIEIPPDVADPRAIADGDWVRIKTRSGRFVARARISKQAAPGSVFAQHGWWVDGPAGTPYAPGAAGGMSANMNQAVDTDRLDPVSGSAALRCTWCELERIAG